MKRADVNVTGSRHCDFGGDRVGQTTDDVVEDDQEGKLDEHREATTSRIHFFLFVETHHLFVELLTVLYALVLLLKLLDLRLQSLHGDHRLRALDGEWGQRTHDDDRQNGDGDRIVGDY